MNLPIALQKLSKKGLLWIPDHVEHSQPFTQEAGSTAHRSLQWQSEKEKKMAFDVLLPNGFDLGEVHEWIQEESTYSLNSPLILLSVLAGNVARKRKETNGDLKTHKSHLAPYLFWIGKESWPTAFILQETLPQRCFPQELLFVDYRDWKECLWAIETILQTTRQAIVIAHSPRMTFVASRRLALLAARSCALVLLIRSWREKDVPSAAISRWLVQPAPSPSQNLRWQLNLLKIRGPRPSYSEWTVEYSDEEKIHFCVPSTLVDRDRTEDTWKRAS